MLSVLLLPWECDSFPSAPNKSLQTRQKRLQSAQIQSCQISESCLIITSIRLMFSPLHCCSQFFPDETCQEHLLGDYRSVHNNDQRGENAASHTTATTRFPQRGLTSPDVSQHSGGTEERLNICNSESPDGEFSADADPSSCKHGSQFCSITSSVPPLLRHPPPPPPPPPVMCWPSSLHPRLFLSVHPADVFCFVCSDEAMLLRVAGADPSCPLCLLRVLSGRICITRRLETFFSFCSAVAAFCQICRMRWCTLSLSCHILTFTDTIKLF